MENWMPQKHRQPPMWKQVVAGALFGAVMFAALWIALAVANVLSQ